jgi:hypothetical protein
MRVLGVAGTLALLVAGGAAGHARAPAGKPQVLQVAGSVSDLSADGGRVAFHVRTGRCQTVRIWAPGRGVTSLQPDCGHNVLVEQLTLAGTRALWVDYDTGNHLYCLLMTATIARPKPTELPECDPTDQDRELHGLAGDGSLFAFSSWYSCSAPGQTCSTGPVGVHGVELWRVLNGRLERIPAGYRLIASVDTGRILFRYNGVALFDANGKQLWAQVPSHDSTAIRARLQGSRGVVQSRSLGPCCPQMSSLGVFDAKTGQYTGADRRLPRGATLADYQDGIAVYLVGGVVHALRMSDGRDRAFRTPGGRPVLDAELERPGLFYSYNARGGAKRGRIAFVRFADLMR